MTDFVEMFQAGMPADPRCRFTTHWASTRETIRKYVAPAVAGGFEPAPDEFFDEQLWRERIGRWFPELIDPSVRALTWDRIAVHRDWIAAQIKARVTVATIAQRLRDEHGVEVSESTVVVTWQPNSLNSIPTRR